MNVRARSFVLFVSVLALSLAVSGCRLLSQQVACLRDGDCPRDVGLGYCDRPQSSDGGVGVCVAEDPDPPPPDDDGGTSFPFLDAGPRDGG